MSQRRQNFDLSTRPKTDVWRLPRGVDDYNAPFTPSTPIPLSSFVSARVTFSGVWVRQYDQAGLLLRITHESSKEPVSWIKCGLERFNGENRLSFVGCDRFADWSVHPSHAAEGDKVTVEVTREGQTLWAYEVIKGQDGEKKYPLRECSWLWNEEEQKKLEVGACVARPTLLEGESDGHGEVLEAHFDELIVDTK